MIILVIVVQGTQKQVLVSSVYFGLTNKIRGWTFELTPFLDFGEVQNVTAGQQELLNFAFKPVELAVLALVRYSLSCRVVYCL